MFASDDFVVGSVMQAASLGWFALGDAGCITGGGFSFGVSDDFLLPLVSVRV